MNPVNPLGRWTPPGTLTESSTDATQPDATPQAASPSATTAHAESPAASPPAARDAQPQKKRLASVKELVDCCISEEGKLLSRDQVIGRLNQAGIIWTPARLLEAMLRAQVSSPISKK